MKVIRLTEKDLTKIVKRLLKESPTFDQRMGYTTTNQEWLDWEKEVIKVEKELKFLGKKIYNELEELEEVLTSIIKNIFDNGDVTHLGLLSDIRSSLLNAPIVRDATERANRMYNDNVRRHGSESIKKQAYLEYLEYKKECDEYNKLLKSSDKITSHDKEIGESACLRVKHTPTSVKTYKEEEYQKPEHTEDKPTESTTPKWYHIIQRTRNEIRDILYQGPGGTSTSMWRYFLNEPLNGAYPLPKIPNLDFLKHSLDEIPKKISNILKEKIPQNQSKEMKRIVELREKYNDLLQTQPVHFVK